MPRRHELTDPQYERIKPILPENGRRGGQWNDHRTTLDGMFWRLNTGCPWRDIPERYGSWSSIHDRFNRWSRDGTLQAIAEVLLVELDNADAVDWDLWCIAPEAAARSAPPAPRRARPNALQQKAIRARRPRPGPLTRRPPEVRHQAAPDRRRPPRNVAPRWRST